MRSRTISLLAALFLLAACSGDGATETTGSSGSATTAGGGDGGTDTTAPMADGGSIVVGSTTGFPQLNPVIRAFQWEVTLYPLLWSGLVELEPDGSVSPGLAETWEASSDFTKWTFQLRDADFADGTPITGDTVKSVFEYYMSPDTATQETPKVSTIETITVEGNTVEFTFSLPNEAFPVNATSIRIIDPANIESINSDPNESGPYMVESFVPDGDLVIVPNPAYWGEAPALEEITFAKAADTTAGVTALQSGDLDVFHSAPISDARRWADDTSDGIGVLFAEASSQAAYVRMDGSDGQFSDPLARQALSYAIDREALVDVVFQGFGVTNPGSVTLHPTSDVYQAAELVEYGYDPEKAQELFEDAGVSEFSFWVQAANPWASDVAQFVQQSLAEIGVEASVDVNETAEWAAAFWPPPQQYPGLAIPSTLSLPSSPAINLGWVYEQSGLVWSGTGRDDLGELLEMAPSQVGDDRVDTYAAALEILNRDQPILVLANIATPTGVSDQVAGIWVDELGTIYLDGAHVDAGS